jgi:hypothetical protein
MQLSVEQTRWLLKVLQPEKTLGSLPGATALSEDVCAALLGLPSDVYATERTRMLGGAKEAARELASESGVTAMIDRLPLKKGARIIIVLIRATLASRGGTSAKKPGSGSARGTAAVVLAPAV